MTSDRGAWGGVDSPEDEASARWALVRWPHEQPTGAEFTEAAVAAAQEHVVGGAIEADNAETRVVSIVRDAQRDSSSSILCSAGLLRLRVEWMLHRVNVRRSHCFVRAGDHCVDALLCCQLRICSLPERVSR